MQVIGITGGVGAGKSSILKYLKDNYNSKIIMADDLAKELCAKGAVCYEPLISLLGNDVLQENGQIDNKKMALKIFSDDNLRTKVNSIIHPAVKHSIIESIDSLKEEGKTDFLFVEAALLIEDGYKAILDELWYIYTDASVRRQRLKLSRGYSDEKIDAIFSSQLSEAEYRANCEFVLDNSGTEEKSFEQIRKRMNNYGFCTK